MQRHSRTQYLFQNTGVRTQRNRVKSLRGTTPNAMNWLNISTVVGEEGVTNWVRAVGFFQPTTLLISHEADFGFENSGILTVTSSVTADFGNIKSSALVDTSSPSAITAFLIAPGDYIAFSAICDSTSGPFTVTIRNKPTNAIIDTFQIQVEV